MATTTPTIRVTINLDPFGDPVNLDDITVTVVNIDHDDPDRIFAAVRLGRHPAPEIYIASPDVLAHLGRRFLEAADAIATARQTHATNAAILAEADNDAA